MKRRGTRGFSLIELMMAMLITALAIAAAAKIAGSAMRSSRRGSETTDLGSRARIISRQLRTDLRLAGAGSTGSIGVSAGVQPWATMSAGFTSPNGFLAIPAVTGANNIPASTAIAGQTTPAWVTDAVQVVVPDPATRQEPQAASARGAASIAGTIAMTCPNQMIYVSDHSASNGAGRTQLIQINNGTAPISFVAGEALLFELAPGAQIMCARVSVYWVATPPGSTVPWLHRTDIQPGVAPLPLVGASGRVYLSAVAPGTDLLAPGVHDMQLAYTFSSELAGLGRLATPAQRWAFTPGGAAAPAGTGWFEVRQVRLNLLVTNLRQLTEAAGTVGELAAEDGAQVPLPIERGRFRLTAAETLNSLRFFDKVVPAGVAAEPY